MSKYKEDIIALRNEGKSYNEISKMLGCSKSVISHHCNKEDLQDIGLSHTKISDGIKNKINELRSEGCSVSQVADKLDISKASVITFSNQEVQRSNSSNVIKNINLDRRNTNYLGDLTELKICTKLHELGYVVSLPFGDNSRYDLIFDNNDGLHKVQCKHGNYSNGVISFRVCSSSKPNEYRTYHDEIDFFGVWCSHNDSVYLIPFDDVSNITGAATLRLVAPKNNVSSNIRWAKDYEI